MEAIPTLAAKWAERDRSVPGSNQDTLCHRKDRANQLPSAPCLMESQPAGSKSKS